MGPVNIGGIDVTTRPLLIAEIGANHEGDIAVAKTMIAEAARAGADLVKFQTYKAEKIVAATDETRRAHFRRLSLEDAAFVELAAEANKHGVQFLSTAFDVEAVDFLEPLMPAFKVASGDLTFTPLLERMAGKGKPILLSTGMAELHEIEKALLAIAAAAGLPRARVGERVVLLHCVSSYPTVPEEANLRAITELREKFPGVSIGYSDHTLGVLAASAAVALGACVIEKHFTLQKEGRTFRDHQLSADPRDLAELSANIRTLTAMLGRGAKVAMPSEQGNLGSMRRSVAARVAIKAGDVIAAEHLTCLRPATGLPPETLPRLVGRAALRDIPAGHVITADAVDLGDEVARQG